jgi:hypothetical protein
VDVGARAPTHGRLREALEVRLRVTRGAQELVQARLVQLRERAEVVRGAARVRAGEPERAGELLDGDAEALRRAVLVVVDDAAVVVRARGDEALGGAGPRALEVCGVQERVQRLVVEVRRREQQALGPCAVVDLRRVLAADRGEREDVLGQDLLCHRSVHGSATQGGCNRADVLGLGVCHGVQDRLRYPGKVLECCWLIILAGTNRIS